MSDMPWKLSENKTLSELLLKIKKPKILLILGAVGILLILFSSLFPTNSNTNKSADSANIQTDEYRKELEKSVEELVKNITGSGEATVVITLESGVRYSYAQAEENSSSNVSASSSAQESVSESNSYITVKTADGSEEALLVTEYMPQIRGVAIVCAAGNDEQIAKKIEGAVTAALNITSKRVYITGGKIR